MSFILVPILIAAIVVVFLVLSTVRVVPQARRYIIERFGRYRTTLQPGLNFIVPLADRINSRLDIREQVFTSPPQPVITEDNLVVNIDTVLYYQITDPRAAVYEVANYLQAIDQLTVTTLRNVIGSMDLERTLTSREEINAQLRTVLDDATGKWGIRVNRVEIKAIDPPPTIKEAMEKQMRAERDKRAAILHAEGERQSKILTAEGTRQQSILEAQGDQQAAILRADGEAKAIDLVFQAVHRNDADPKVLAYKYLETLPQLAAGDNNTLWVIPGELTRAIEAVTEGFAGRASSGAPARGRAADGVDDRGTGSSEASGEPSADLAEDSEEPPAPDGGPLALTEGQQPAYDVTLTDQVAEMVKAAIAEANTGSGAGDPDAAGSEAGRATGP